MPPYLSDAWVAALDDIARNHRGLAEATAGTHLVLEQVVILGGDATDTSSETSAGGEAPAPTGEVRWHVLVDDGSVRFRSGAAPSPTVRFTTDEAMARAITEGRCSATEAFMNGRLRVGGDTTALVRYHDLFSGLADVFAAVTVD